MNRHQLRSQDCRFKALEAFRTALTAMELDNKRSHKVVHRVLTYQLLDILEQEHHAYMVKEGLDIREEEDQVREISTIGSAGGKV